MIFGWFLRDLAHLLRVHELLAHQPDLFDF